MTEFNTTDDFTYLQYLHHGYLLHGKYQYVSNLNTGSYGDVTLARRVSDSLLVAIKCQVKASADSGQLGAAHEIDIHRRLGSHPGIVAMLDHFDTKLNTYLVLEYEAGGDLYDYLKTNGLQGLMESTEEAVAVLKQLVEAVEYAHSRGVYHRDIKPENILVASNGTLKLCDWGLATTNKFSRDLEVGTSKYMAPEMFRENNLRGSFQESFADSTVGYDSAKLDVWSVAVTVLYVVFGKCPFVHGASEEQERMFQHYEANYEILYDIYPSMTADCMAVVRCGLAVDPAQRSLQKMAEQLGKLEAFTIDDADAEYGFSETEGQHSKQEEMFAMDGRDEELEELEELESLRYNASTNVSAVPSLVSTGALSGVSNNTASSYGEAPEMRGLGFGLPRIDSETLLSQNGASAAQKGSGGAVNGVNGVVVAARKPGRVGEMGNNRQTGVATAGNTELKPIAIPRRSELNLAQLGGTTDRISAYAEKDLADLVMSFNLHDKPRKDDFFDFSSYQEKFKWDEFEDEEELNISIPVVH